MSLFIMPYEFKNFIQIVSFMLYQARVMLLTKDRVVGEHRKTAMA